MMSAGEELAIALAGENNEVDDGVGVRSSFPMLVIMMMMMMIGFIPSRGRNRRGRL